MWPFDKTKTVVALPDRPAPPVAEHVELPTPACMQFDSDEVSDFGTQVVMLMEMKPQEWSVHPNYRMFRHPQLGVFQFDGDERLRHFGDYDYGPGSMYPPGKQRALTRGDQKAIVDSLRAMLLKPVELVEPKVEGTGTGAAASAQQKLYNQQMSLLQQYAQQQGLASESNLQREMAQLRKELMRDQLLHSNAADAYRYAANPLSPVHAPNTLPSVLSNTLKK